MPGRPVVLLALVALALGLGACGKKGPLYLPDPARTLVAPFSN